MSHQNTVGVGFGTALACITAGLRVRRMNWPEKTYIWNLPQAEVKAEWIRDPHLKSIAEELGGSVVCAASLRRRFDNKVETGWQPNAADLIADDWEVLVNSREAQRVKISPAATSDFEAAVAALVQDIKPPV